MTTKRPPLPINPDYQVEVSCCWDNRFLPNLFLKQNNLRQELIMLPHQTCRQPPTSKVYKFLHFNFLRLNMYSTARRDVLGCTSPTTKRFPSKSQGSREISRSEKISRSSGMDFQIYGILVILYLKIILFHPTWRKNEVLVSHGFSNCGGSNSKFWKQ